MCQATDDGGRRCADYERLKSCSTSHFAPEPREGVPDVAWRNESLDDLWHQDADKRAGTCAALLMLEKAKKQEPEITGAVMTAAAASGSVCAHLEQRIKSPASLSRKVLDESQTAAESGGNSSPGLIAGEMKDVIRYTVVNPEHSKLSTVTKKTIESLQGQGWTILKIKNTYTEGASYKGVHINIIGTTPDGITAEVQVHSEASLAVKNRIHGAYEIYRDPSKSVKERRAAMQECIRESASLTTPEDQDLLTGVEWLGVSKS